MRRLASLLLLAWPLVATAGEPIDKGKVRFTWGGHLKVFALASLPLPLDTPSDPLVSILNPLPSEPSGQGFLDGRLNLGLEVADWFQVQAAHAITTTINGDAAADASNAALIAALEGPDALRVFADLGRLNALVDADPSAGLTGGFSGGGGPFNTGVGLRAPEAFPLTWTAWDDPPGDVRVQFRTDRLLLKFSPKHLDITVGRQPITFGHGLFFTPLDLVSPFNPATIDAEYKPGVDAVRLDGFFGTSGQVTVLTAWLGQGYLHEGIEEGQPASASVGAAAYGQMTVGVTDLGLFYGFIRGDHVVGATTITGIGPVGLHADVAVTVPRADLDEEVFVRGVIGLDGRPTGTTTLAGEIYVQSFGSLTSDGLFERLASERVRRGEVWQSGLLYAGLSVTQEITPLLIANVAVIGNLTEPSFLLAPTLSWSPAQNVEAAFGGFVGLGARPEVTALDLDALEARKAAGETIALSDLSVVRPRSELGTYPATLFVQVRAYF